MAPVSARFVLACRDTLAAGLATSFADTVQVGAPGAGSPGVRVHIWEAPARRMDRLAPAHLDELHEDVTDFAWRDGAWDMSVLAYPALERPQWGVVTSYEYADRALGDALLDAAERGSLISWIWKPMRASHHVRRKAWAAKDTTLEPDSGRRGSAPAVPAVDWTRTGRQTIVRLGRRPTSTPRVVRATSAQRSYIVGLRHKLGRHGESLPAALGRREASRLIDTLLAELAAAGRPESRT